MASVSDVYGEQYHRQNKEERSKQVIQHIVNNLSHLELQFTLFSESHTIWRENDIDPTSITYLVSSLQKTNPKLRLFHVPKTSPLIHSFPYFKNGPAEYFVLLHLETKHLYQFVITPSRVTPY